MRKTYGHKSYVLVVILSCTILINFGNNIIDTFAQENNLPFDKIVKFNLTDDEITKTFWDWSHNLSVEEIPDSANPSKETECVMYKDKNKKIVILLDPYFVGKIVQKCDIPTGYYIIVPLYNAHCDTGQTGSENFTFEQLLQCAKDADKGDLLVKMDIDNINFINYKASVGNSPQNEYIKEIESSKSENSTTSPNSRFITSGLYAKPGTYPTASHGWFAILPPLTEGTHTLSYRIEVVATGDLLLKANEWNFVSEITYLLNVNK